MTYGDINDHTRKLIEQRRIAEHIAPNKINLDVEFNEEGIPVTTNNLYQFTIIFDGVLDEEFYAETIYEINIADWLAEDCEREAIKQTTTRHPVVDWVILVSEWAYEDAGSLRYKVIRESYLESH